MSTVTAALRQAGRLPLFEFIIFQAAYYYSTTAGRAFSSSGLSSKHRLKKGFFLLVARGSLQ